MYRNTISEFRFYTQKKKYRQSDGKCRKKTPNGGGYKLSDIELENIEVLA